MPLFGKDKKQEKAKESGGYPAQSSAAPPGVYGGPSYNQPQNPSAPPPYTAAAAPPYGAPPPVGGYAPPPHGYAPPPQGYAPHPQGYAAPGYAQGYAPPQHGYAPPPQGYAPPPQGYPQAGPSVQPSTVVMQGGFDAGARFNNGSPPSVPPPPPGCMPNAAQMAQMQGQNVVVTQQQGNWMTGGSDGGYTIF